MREVLNENNIMIGSDPELFCVTYQNNQEYCVPPIILEEEGLKIISQELRNDGKTIKHSYYYDEDDIKILSDGSAFELTVKPVLLSNLEELYERIRRGYELTGGMINPFGYFLSVIPTINFDIEKYGIEKYETACESGCDPDLDAWNEEWVCETFSTKNYPYRHGGAHIHFGLPEKYIEEFHIYSIQAVKFLSMTVGSYFLINSPESKLDSIRLNYFGKPGKYRKPKYGIEYRSPSNAWTTKKEILLNSKKWILIGLNLLFHEKGEDILNNFSKEFLRGYYNQDVNLLKSIMERIEKIYYE